MDACKHSRNLARKFARTLLEGSSFIALGVAIGVVLSRHEPVARALACAALVVEIGSAVVVMRRGLRMVERMERERKEAMDAEPANAST